MARFLIAAVIAVLFLPDIHSSIIKKTDDSDITFVKIRPLVNTNKIKTNGKYRSSRIQNLPLQIKPLTEKDSQEKVLQQLGSEPPVRVEGRKPRETSENKTAPVVVLVPKLHRDDTSKVAADESYVDDDEISDDEEFEPPTEAVALPSTSRKTGRKIAFHNYLSNGEYNFLGSHQDPHLRTFRSKCKCETLLRCVKLQLSVPRCPTNEFYCCS